MLVTRAFSLKNGGFLNYGFQFSMKWCSTSYYKYLQPQDINKNIFSKSKFVYSRHIRLHILLRVLQIALNSEKNGKRNQAKRSRNCKNAIFVQNWRTQVLLFVSLFHHTYVSWFKNKTVVFCCNRSTFNLISRIQIAHNISWYQNHLQHLRCRTKFFVALNLFHDYQN